MKFQKKIRRVVEFKMKSIHNFHTITTHTRMYTFANNKTFRFPKRLAHLK